jgi:hypothetical protein
MADEKEERSGDRELVVRRGPAGKQIKRARKDGWTARKREIFPDHLRATCNVTASAREAGMGLRSVFRLRNRDAAFADQWDATLRDYEARLAGQLIVYAETQGKALADAPPGSDASDIDGFDPELALRMLSYHRERLAGRRRRGGAPKRVATPEETDAEILRLLKALGKRLRRKQ